MEGLFYSSTKNKVLFGLLIKSFFGFPSGSDGKRIFPQCGKYEIDPWARKIPWRRAWQPTPVFLPRESPGQRSLVGYNPWGLKESDMT